MRRTWDSLERQLALANCHDVISPEQPSSCALSRNLEGLGQLAEIDIDEKGEQALRDSLWDGRTERKALNQDQCMGEEFA